MRIAICDSDKACMVETKKLCKEYFGNKNIDTEILEYSSGTLFLNSQEEIDILLIGITLKDMDGLIVRRQLFNRDIIIIYLAEDDSCMQKAFGRQVYGFLIKPLKRKELYNIFDYVLEEQLSEQVIEINDKDEPYVKAGLIMYIIAEDKYTRVYTVEREFLVLRSMIEWERILVGQNFCRIHRSHIVNFEYIKTIESGVTMVNGVKLNISRNKKSTFKDAYSDYFKRKMITKNI